jgi:hypothetical protein
MNATKDPTEHPAPQPSAPAAKDTSPLKDASRFEKYAATQAAADGVEGDVRKKNKTEEEKLAAQMTDRR